MSHNLHLLSGRRDVEDAGLFQTPSDVSFTATACGADAKAIYFAWLERTFVEPVRPKIHPRATNAQCKAIQSTPAWKKYVDTRREIDEHKAMVEQFLRSHPGAKWVAL